jgi:hypothetical protein
MMPRVEKVTNMSKKEPPEAVTSGGKHPSNRMVCRLNDVSR